MKKIHFISGLPRSGSTLLCNILNQNPRFHATETSGVLGIILQVRNTWNQNIELMASYKEDTKIATMKGILQGFHSNTNTDIIFDKSRGWCGNVELAELLTEDAKIIVTVRDISDIMSSFEKLFRKNAGKDVFPQEKQFPIKWKTLEGRVEVMLQGDQPIGAAYNALRDAIQRGYEDKLHIVEFEDLTHEPTKTLKSLYKFLGEKWFKHDFTNVEQTTIEDDKFHGIDGLHNISSKVVPLKSDARKILGEPMYKQLSNQEFWR